MGRQRKSGKPAAAFCLNLLLQDGSELIFKKIKKIQKSTCNFLLHDIL